MQFGKWNENECSHRNCSTELFSVLSFPIENRICVNRLVTTCSPYLIWDGHYFEVFLQSQRRSVLLLTAGLVPQQIHPRLFTGALYAHWNWQLCSAVCKAGTQALEFVVDLSRHGTVWLTGNHAGGGSYFITHGRAPSHLSVSLSDTTAATGQITPERH